MHEYLEQVVVVVEPVSAGLECWDDAGVQVSAVSWGRFVTLQGDEVTDPTKHSLTHHIIHIDPAAGDEGDEFTGGDTGLEVGVPDWDELVADQVQQVGDPGDDLFIIVLLRMMF